MLPEQVRATGADILLGNYLPSHAAPNGGMVAKLGGLHKFMQWDGPILTDSGGFQVIRFAKLRKITENGSRSSRISTATVRTDAGTLH